MKVNIGKYEKDDTRKASIKFDEGDFASLDYTLALIIHPSLVKFKSLDVGYPMVDDKDVPKTLRSIQDKNPDKKDWEPDAFANERWNWVLDEMIWAFKEAAYSHPGEDEIWDDKSIKNKLKADQKYRKRLQNGFRLFGKYYQSL